jgi:hypothetical protein
MRHPLPLLNPTAREASPPTAMIRRSRPYASPPHASSVDIASTRTFGRASSGPLPPIAVLHDPRHEDLDVGGARRTRPHEEQGEDEAEAMALQTEEGMCRSCRVKRKTNRYYVHLAVAYRCKLCQVLGQFLNDVRTTSLFQFYW